jgi:hypothetical protein
MSFAFVNSDKYARERIALVVSSWGLCTSLARQVVWNEQSGTNDSSVPPHYLNELVERKTAAVSLERMGAASREEFVSTFSDATEAIDELTLWGCSSNKKVKDRARVLLLDYFAIIGSDLPCLPCE